MKAYNQEPEQCWECYSCVKICPAGDRMPSLRRHRADGRLRAATARFRLIMWTIKFRNGNMKRFKFPIRTTPEGSIDPYKDKPKADMSRSVIWVLHREQHSQG